MLACRALILLIRSAKQKSHASAIAESHEVATYALRAYGLWSVQETANRIIFTLLRY